MEHVLNNPVWSALSTGNKHLAMGTNGVKFFDHEVSPFVSFETNRPDNFDRLHEQITHNNTILFVTPAEMAVPEHWKVMKWIPGYQMVYEADRPIPQPIVEIVNLTAQHVPQMVALTKLTNPGPFAQRTIEFGHYRGIFTGGQLVAMAGQRLDAVTHKEISAVCTHPHYLGKGYARQLLLHHIGRIKAAGAIPFLHVRDSNERAIKVYQDLGFTIRIPVHFYLMNKILYEHK